MKVVILAGGYGTRISEESRFKPKPLIEIGGMPILWHIMKCYSHFGYNDFIICCGYKQSSIKEWFSNYYLSNSDITFDFRHGEKIKVHHSNIEPWCVTLVDTGLSTMTGGRIKRIEEYTSNETFMLTYGDAVCDVDINRLVQFHRTHGKLATVTAVIQKQEKGILDINEYGAVKAFREKNAIDNHPINAGFMVIEPGIFKYLIDDATIFENVVLEELANENQLMSYVHHGFWQCMDSAREKELLDKYWNAENAPWKVW